MATTVIAVAGASSGLGRALLDLLKDHPKYRVVIISRKPNPLLEEETGFKVAITNYESVDEVARSLQQEDVGVVISTMNYGTDATPELNLIKAADQTASVKRYIPSIWGSFLYGPDFAHLAHVQPKLAIKEALKSTRTLEYMSIYNGMFIDYYAGGGMKTYAGDIGIVVDMSSNSAAIGGSGEVPVSLSYTFDVAKFTIAALELLHWSREEFIIGDTVTWNEFVSIAEEAKGVTFDIYHDSLEACRKGECTLLPNQKILEHTWPPGLARGLYSWFAVIAEEGLLNHSKRALLNERFPEIKAHTVRSFLTQAYAKK